MKKRFFAWFLMLVLMSSCLGGITTESSVVYAEEENQIEIMQESDGENEPDADSQPDTEPVQESNVGNESGTESVQNSEAEDKSAEVQSISTETDAYVNPIYENIAGESQLDELDNGMYKAGIAAYSEPVYLTMETEVIAALREAMVHRENAVIYYQTTENLSWSAKNSELVDAAWKETGKEKEGDYLRWHIVKESGTKGGKKVGNIYYYTLTFNFTYLTTTKQEEELDSAVDSVYTELGLGNTSLSDYQKIRIVYDYICKNVKYDNVNDDTYLLKYSAYAALVNKNAVCQGYATLLYRLLTRAGISTRVITGDAGGTGHAWNIVGLSGKYYYMDATWDAGSDDYRYFLKGSDVFSGHTSEAEYLTSAFQTAYPISNFDWGMAFNVSELSLAVGKTGTLAVEYGEGVSVESSEVTWSSSDTTTATVSGGKVTAVGAGTAVITAKCGEYEAVCTVTVTDSISVQYRTHVQTYGWQSHVADGVMSGTTGQAKRLEAIQIQLKNQIYSGNIEYRTHVQTYGWQGYVKNAAVSGTSGQSKRLEAIQIRLTGEMAKHYDIYYRVHAQTYGWLGWAKNGGYAGTAGYSKRLEGIEIKLVKKNGKAPGSTENAYYHPLVEYQTHVQTYGWQGYVKDGAVSGTVGRAKRLEGIMIQLSNQEYSGNIEYQTHVQTYGWQDWKKNGTLSGTTGQAKRLEAIRIRLTGEMANHYDVYYRVHSQTYGWLGWAKNGESAGTAGLAKRLEGIEIRLAKKGSSAPGSTSGAFIDKTV